VDLRQAVTLPLEKKLAFQGIKEQTGILLKVGYKRILMVAGEMSSSEENMDYYVGAVKAIYSADYKGNKIKKVKVNVNVVPVSLSGFKRLKEAGVDTYQTFQETYHEETYRKLYAVGEKS
jgi:2-iminoacetate synthase